MDYSFAYLEFQCDWEKLLRVYSQGWSRTGRTAAVACQGGGEENTPKRILQILALLVRVWR